MRLALQVIVMFVVVLFVGINVGENFVSEVPEPDEPSRSTGESTLEVRPANGEGPEPLDFNLQGSSPGGQEAQGGLQTPQTVDDLQPNARTDLFRDDS